MSDAPPIRDCQSVHGGIAAEPPIFESCSTHYSGSPAACHTAHCSLHDQQEAVGVAAAADSRLQRCIPTSVSPRWCLHQKTVLAARHADALLLPCDGVRAWAGPGSRMLTMLITETGTGHCRFARLRFCLAVAVRETASGQRLREADPCFHRTVDSKVDLDAGGRANQLQIHSIPIYIIVTPWLCDQ